MLDTFSEIQILIFYSSAAASRKYLDLVDRKFEVVLKGAVQAVNNLLTKSDCSMHIRRVLRDIATRLNIEIPADWSVESILDQLACTVNMMDERSTDKLYMECIPAESKIYINILVSLRSA